MKLATKPLILWFATALALLITVPSKCGAVIIFRKDNPEPIKGYLVSQDAVRVIINQVLPNGEKKQLILPRAVISEVLITVSEAKLSQLRRDQPEAYRNYAEELSEKRDDPDARATAIRLYLIAAYLDPQRLGRSCLLGMAALARTPREQRRFRAMVYLLDPDHDRSLLQSPEVLQVDPGGLDGGQRTLLLRGLRALRGGNKPGALNLSRRPAFQDLLKRFGDVLTVEEFAAAARQSDDRVSRQMLKRILTLELALSPGSVPTVNEAAADAPQTWSQIVVAHGLEPVAALELSTLTEFDPRQCHYRDGKWVEPM